MCNSFAYFFLSLFFQLADERSAFSEYITLAEHQFTSAKTKLPGKSELILVLSNWRFTRDLSQAYASKSASVKCKPSNCTVSFKISSSDFGRGENNTRQNPLTLTETEPYCPTQYFQFCFSKPTIN
jgi:hypothetical protein